MLKITETQRSLTGNWLKRIVAIAAFALLTSCAAIRIAYNNADVLVRVSVRQHFDLQGLQDADFQSRLARFHQWHRRQELPHYEALLRSAEGRLTRGLTTEDVYWATQAVRERYRALMRHVAHEAAPVLVTLTPAQLTHLEKQLAEDNRKFAKKHLAGSEEKQLKARTKWIREQFEDWIGSLTPEQEARITAMAKASPPVATYRLEERKRNQQRFLALLRTYRRPDELANALQDLLENFESRRPPEFVHAMQDIESRLARLVVDLDKTLSPAQRTYATQRFASFAADFRTLAQKGQGVSTGSAFLDPVASLCFRFPIADHCDERHLTLVIHMNEPVEHRRR